MHKKAIASGPVPCDLCGGTEYDVRYRDLTDTALAPLEARANGAAAAHGGLSLMEFGRAELFQIVSCQNCGLVQLFPRPVREEIMQHYSAEYIPYQRDNLIMTVVNMVRWSVQERGIRLVLGGAGSILEVGCARGEFLLFLSHRGWQATGIEMDRQSAAIARQINGLSVWEGIFEEYTIPADSQFDCVLMRFVLEHLASPKDGLHRAAAMLRPGGIAVVSIPNFDSWERRIFGRWWHCFDVPRHFYIFTEGLMRVYAMETGFRVERVQYACVPNDWIGSIARMLREKKYEWIVSFFTYRNPFLWPIFFPCAAIGALFQKSSRFTFILRRV